MAWGTFKTFDPKEGVKVQSIFCRARARLVSVNVLGSRLLIGYSEDPSLRHFYVT